MPTQDTILFQDKGVMQSNISEVIRAHQVAANRVIALEKKLADVNVGDGSDFAGLKTKLDDLTASVNDLHAEADKTKAKLDQLFPDQQTPTDPGPGSDSAPATEGEADHGSTPESTPAP